MGDYSDFLSNIKFLSTDNNEYSPPWQPPADDDWFGRMGEETKTGFKNKDSVCYRNSVLQMLAHSITLLHWLEWYRFHHVAQYKECTDGKNHGRCKLCLIYDVLLTFWVRAAGNCEVTLDALWEQVFPDWNDGTMTGEQDAAEFWSELYRQMAEDIKTIYLPDLQNLCRLTTVAVIQCQGPNACPTKTYRPDETEFLCARFPNDDSDSSISMRDAINQYFTESLIEDAVCDKCHNPRSHSEKLVHLPNYLLIKVNRIEHVNGPNGPEIKKLTRDIALDNRLTFSADRFDPRSSAGKDDIEYELTAMVMHAGETITTGHFYAFVKARGSNWMMASDLTLEPFPGWSAVSESAQARRDAYIFAYCRVPPNVPFIEKPVSQVPTPSTVKLPTTPLKQFPELLTKRRGAAWATKRSVIEGYKAELEAIQESSEWVGPSSKEPVQEAINEEQAHPDDVQEAIKGFRSLKSTLRTIPDVPETPENPNALVKEYQKVKEILLDQLGTEPPDDIEERQRLTEEVICNVKEQLDRLTASKMEEQYWSPAPKRARDDTDDVLDQPQPKRRFRQRMEEKMRGLVDILFTPDGSDEPVLHGRMKGLFRDVISEKSSKATKGTSKETGQSGSPGKPVTGSTALAAETGRITRTQAKRKAVQEFENFQAHKRSKMSS